MSETERRPRELAARPANRAYYDACEGAWRGELAFAITDAAAFRRAPLSTADRLRVRAMLAADRLLGRARFETTVSVLGSDEIVHTTRISRLGVPLFASRERLVLDPDGQGVRMTIASRTFPLFWPARSEGPFRAAVDENATRAVYELSLFGCPMRQTAARDGSSVTLVQETAWSRSEQRLARVR